MSTILRDATHTCQACGGTGVAAAHYPEALRLLDAKGRFTSPWVIRGRTYRVELRGPCVWFVPDPQGLAVPTRVEEGSTCYRLTIPAEFRSVLDLKPGADVALAREGRSLLAWRHEL